MIFLIPEPLYWENVAMKQYTKIDNAYDFLSHCSEFNLSELAEASGWSEKNTKANISKKLKDFLGKGVHKEYKVLSLISSYNKDDFRKIFSQTYTVKIPTKVEQLLNKSKECVLIAVQNYNNPVLEYRLGSFITMSFIGFASLFHAVYERDGISYIKPNNDFINLLEALNCYKGKREYNTKYEKDYLKKEVLKNVEGLRSFRNDIEHSYCELLDIDLYPLCQKILYDYQKILMKEFGREHNISNKLCLALQFSYQFDYSQMKQDKEYKELRERIAKHMETAKGEYPSIIPLMIPANKYKEIDITKLDSSKYAKIIAVVQEQHRNNAQNTAEILNNFIKKELGCTEINFDSIKLLKLSRVLGWRDNGKKILNETYLGYDDLRKGGIYYRDTSIEYIKSELRYNLKGVLKKILPETKYRQLFKPE